MSCLGAGAPAVCILETEEVPLPRMQKKQTRSDGHICASGYVHKQELSRRAGQAEPIFCLGFGPRLCQITDVAADPSMDIRNGGQSIGLSHPLRVYDSWSRSDSVTCLFE